MKRLTLIMLQQIFSHRPNMIRLLRTPMAGSPTTSRAVTQPTMKTAGRLTTNATAATLIEDDQLYVRIYVPETRIGVLKLNAVVPVTVDSFPGRSFQACCES